jgi:cellulose synthase/poly-beta-1,6-N-acetylglucosamine synthase-like glycosyltransferase
MTAVEIAQLIVGGYATAWALYLLFFPLAAIAPKSTVKARETKGEKNWPPIAVIIPGRNVAEVVGQCIVALRACQYPAERLDIYVVADHCTDDTADRARSSGVAALIRDEGPTGKTYTLGWTFDVLKARRLAYDLCVVVDATARVEAGFLYAFAKSWQEGAHIIANHTVVASDNRTWYTRCLALMFVHRNLQNWSRERFGLSALLTGCGMAFSREYIQRFGWSLALPKTQGAHPTEDWRHAVRAVGEGYRVAYADHARVSTPLRSSLAEATRQGARWERGRLLNAGTYALRLLWRGLWERDRLNMFAALDAMQPPVAILAALSVTVAGVTYLFSSGNHPMHFGGYLPAILVGLYGMIVVMRGRRDGISPSTILWGPIYMIWRCSAFILAWIFLDRMNFGKGGGVTARIDKRSQSDMPQKKSKNVASDALTKPS